MNRYLGALVACVTLGLAPFWPTPHIVEKVRWLLGGGRGMSALDIFDVVFHGAPWLFLIAISIRDLARKLSGAHLPATNRKTTLRVIRIAVVGAALCVLWSHLPR